MGRQGRFNTNRGISRSFGIAIALAAAVGLSAGLSGCSADAGPKVSATAGPTASATPEPGSALGPAQFAAALKLPDTTLIDVRTPAEFAQGHLPGAINIDYESPDFLDQVSALHPDLNYALYCHSGNRSGAALGVMTGMGITEVFHLDGGISAWQEAGGEVVTD